jgi:hypothetical protein
MLVRMDWESPEGRLIVAAREALIAHVGGNPTVVERVLIERSARLQLFIEQMDARALRAGEMSDRDMRQYLSWVSALRRCLRELGVKEAPAAKPPGLEDIVAGKGAKR